MSKQSRKNKQPGFTMSKEELFQTIRTGAVNILLITRPTDGDEIVWATKHDHQPLSKPFVSTFHKYEKELWAMLTISDARLCTDRAAHAKTFYHLHEELNLMCCSACKIARAGGRQLLEESPTLKQHFEGL